MRPPRTLVLCFDGTSNEYDANNTNVVKLFSLLKKDNIDQQMCYYQAGVGTYFQPGVVSPLFQWGAKILDEAVAWYLPAHVMDGYKFLMQNWNTGDKVCLFGFSRGAYTARALAGMLYKVGLLPRDNEEQVPFAYRLYASSKSTDLTLAAGFKTTFCRDVPIEFVGVWDTVASVGIVMTKSLPFVSTNNAIRTFRHALSLDEHRAKFRPNLYHRPEMTPSGLVAVDSSQHPTLSALRMKIRRSWQEKNRKFEEAMGYGDGHDVDTGSNGSGTRSPGWTTDVCEVWFSGCHSDVGGGAVTDATEYALADIPLRWMVREVMLAQCGITFEEAALTRWNIPLTATEAFKKQTSKPSSPAPGAASPVSANGKDSVENGGDGGNGQNGRGLKRADSVSSWVATRELADAVQPMDDELKKQPLWWILEILPTKYSYQDVAGKWITFWSIHLGRGRYTPPQPKFHESVKVRMEDVALKYAPRAIYDKGTETYVR